MAITSESEFRHLVRLVGAVRTLGLLGTLELPGADLSASMARAYVRELLGAAGHPKVDEVELLVSELVTNAVRHSDSGRRAHGVVRLVVADDGHALHVAVIDEGSSEHVPRMRPLSADSDGGRGLWLVDQIASEWGAYEDRAGHVVWFQVAGR